MQRRTALWIGLGLVAFGLLGLAGTLLLSGGVGAPGPNEVDAMFIREMVPHHQDAIDMAKLAMARAEHPELRELADDIYRSQSEENERMRRWYREWYGTDVPEGGSGMSNMMGTMTDMAALENAEDFDREFIEQMVPHHQMALMMAGMAGPRSRHAELRELTDSILRVQSREIEMMQGWYSEWYGR